MKCYECGESRARYKDPRDSPANEGEILCKGCLEAAIWEAITEHEGEIESLKELAVEHQIKL